MNRPKLKLVDAFFNKKGVLTIVLKYDTNQDIKKVPVKISRKWKKSSKKDRNNTLTFESTGPTEWLPSGEAGKRVN